jgi:hypothetical protein
MSTWRIGVEEVAELEEVDGVEEFEDPGEATPASARFLLARKAMNLGMAAGRHYTPGRT